MTDNTEATPKVQGPAFYFPSIEKKYGHPIDHWLSLVRDHPAEKHMATVSWLKSRRPTPAVGSNLAGGAG